MTAMNYLLHVVEKGADGEGSDQNSQFCGRLCEVGLRMCRYLF